MELHIDNIEMIDSYEIIPHFNEILKIIRDSRYLPGKRCFGNVFILFIPTCVNCIPTAYQRLTDFSACDTFFWIMLIYIHMICGPLSS